MKSATLTNQLIDMPSHWLCKHELHASRHSIKALRTKLEKPLTDKLFGFTVHINDAIETPMLVRKDSDNRIVDFVELEVANERLLRRA